MNLVSRSGRSGRDAENPEMEDIVDRSAARTGFRKRVGHFLPKAQHRGARLGAGELPPIGLCQPATGIVTRSGACV